MDAFSSSRVAVVAFATAAVSLGSAASADAQLEEDFALWAALFFTGQVHADSPSPTFWFDAHIRRFESSTVQILRPAVGLAFAPWGSLWLGYAWIPTWNEETGQRSDEQRIWEQLTLTYRGGPVLLQSRTRFEQRYLKGASGTAHRFRQFVRFNYKPKGRVPVGIALWDEVFVGIQGATWAKQSFDQNRVFLGPAIYAFDGLFRVEVGYLNVFVSRETRQLIHIASFNFIVSFKGKEKPRNRGTQGS